MAGKSDSPFSFFPVGELKQWPWRHPISLEEPDGPVLLMADGEGKRVLALANLPQGVIFTNVAEHMRCMHSDARVPPLDPGGTFATRGAVFFVDGSIRDAETAYLEWLTETDRNQI